MKRPPAFLLIIMAGVAAEALLILRLWAQVTSRPIDSANLRFLFSVTQDLASPFSLVTNEDPVQTSGIVDFTVLVAIEGYLIATLALIALCFIVNRSVSLFTRRKRVALRGLRVLPDGPLWQSVNPPHSPAATYYLRLQPARRHQKRRSA